MRKFSLCLALFVVLGCVSCAFAVEYGATGYETEGYDEAHAWEISSAATLVRVRDEVNTGRADALQAGAYYKLKADIDLSSYTDWNPIGEYGEGVNGVSHFFTGNFDGNGHTITVNISSVSGQHTYAGLFGYVRGGTIKNLSVSGNVSLAMSTTMKNLYSGGIVVVFYSGTMENCCFDGTVIASQSSGTGSAYAGGLAASVLSTGGPVSIINCKVGSKASTKVAASRPSYNTSSHFSIEGGLIGSFLDSNLMNKVTGNYSRVTLGGRAIDSGAIYGKRSGGSMGEVSNNTEASPNDAAPDTPSSDTPLPDTPLPDTPTTQNPGGTNTGNQNQQNNNSGSSSGGGGGGGCETGAGLLGLAVIVASLLLKRSK